MDEAEVPDSFEAELEWRRWRPEFVPLRWWVVGMIIPHPILIGLNSVLERRVLEWMGLGFVWLIWLAVFRWKGGRRCGWVRLRIDDGELALALESDGLRRIPVKNLRGTTMTERGWTLHLLLSGGDLRIPRKAFVREGDWEALKGFSRRIDEAS